MIKLSPEGLQLILDWEVGGGEKYYNKFCARPDVPGGKDTESGITIGIGWDIGAHLHAELYIDWEDFVAPQDLAKLLTAVGLKGDAAKRVLPQMQPVAIPWDKALDQFQRFTVPSYWLMTSHTFPGIDNAPQCVREAVLCLVFNRGPSLDGPRRVEMRFIAIDIAHSAWSRIPSELRNMKRLWPDTESLRNRREAEAEYIEKGLGGSD